MDIVKVTALPKHADRSSIVRRCVVIVALTLASCQNASEQPVSSSSYARPQKSSVVEDSQLKPPAPAGEALNPWVGRSGEAEALADIANGRPVKLFYQYIAGERMFIRTPGLLNCNPERYDVSEDARSKLVPLGADYSESVQYTNEERSRITSATLFARAYNVTMFTKKRDDVLKICPAATHE